MVNLNLVWHRREVLSKPAVGCTSAMRPGVIEEIGRRFILAVLDESFLLFNYIIAGYLDRSWSLLHVSIRYWKSLASGRKDIMDNLDARQFACSGKHDSHLRCI